MATSGLISILVFAAFFYFIPSMVAASRSRAVAPVFALNLLLGWTFVGWVVALIWALTENTPSERERMRARNLLPPNSRR